MSREFTKSRKTQPKQEASSEAQSFIDRYTFAEAQSRPHPQIGGRTDYMRYRIAQFALDKFDFRDPLILEAIVLSYAYEKRRGSGESLIRGGVAVTEPSLEMSIEDIENHIGRAILDATTSGMSCDPSLIHKALSSSLDDRSSLMVWY